MSISFSADSRIFCLRTAGHIYQMQVVEGDILLHLYYGKAAEGDMSYLLQYADRGFSGNPYEQRYNRCFSLDTLPQEYASSGVGDYRVSAVKTITTAGSRSVDLRYVGYEIQEGRLPVPGLPYVRNDNDTETLIITMQDNSIGLTAELFYHVFPKHDVICRSVRLINSSTDTLTIEKAMSMCIDFPYGNFDVVHFHGRHCMERMAERLCLPKGNVSFGSNRGMSSHQHNPFVILCDHHATENAGDCYGFMLMYSGNHIEEVEVNQFGSTRLVSGIHPDNFSWRLNPGETFDAPEAILSYSENGLNGLSSNYHCLIRDLVIDSKYRNTMRPILINSWEAAYFNFDAEKILGFARSAKESGVEMLVLDDGWFGKRNDDNCSLGDWTVNEEKLGCSMQELSDQIHKMGMQFGLWFEPEMISEDSDLFRNHPDWALRDPDRDPTVARNQMVLDMSRQDVVDYLYQSISNILDNAKIEYIKWDFNRSIANYYSHALPAERQGEVAHRFMLSTYSLLDKILTRYPDLLIEGCAGGGGRFDAGMLFYCPQIWCSDDSDAVERLEIQRGTSYGYPVSTMGAHVSAVPNHQTGRTVPLKTRGIVAQSGTFGYELNPASLSDKEKAEMAEQISDYHKYAALISEGTYYRLTELGDSSGFEAWMIVSPDREEAIVNVVMTHVRANGPFPWIRLQGLLPDCLYHLEGTQNAYSGVALMQAGYSFPQLNGDYPAVQLHFEREKKQ